MHITECISVQLCVSEPSPEKNKINSYFHWKLKKLLSGQISLALSGFTMMTSDKLRGLHKNCSLIFARFLRGECPENG